MGSTPWIINWIDEFSLHKELDEEHQQFIKCIDELNTVLANQDREKERAKVILEKLLQETEEHFNHEEQLFIRLSIGNMDEHRAKHIEIVKNVKSAMQQFNSAELPKIWMKIAMSIKSVLIEHFLECDFSEIEQAKQQGNVHSG